MNLNKKSSESINQVNDNIFNGFNISSVFNKDIEEKVENKNRLFTHHNYGYKCCCTKTQCIRKYCQCFNEGRYCVDCDCRNCLNQLPKYSSTNIKNVQTKTVICTCTKSGCNKNYCECFKILPSLENSVYIISNICVIEKKKKKIKNDKLLNKKRKKANKQKIKY